MASIRINDGIIVDYTSDGWIEYKKWLDGTYARLKFVYSDLGAAYDIVAIDGRAYRLLSIDKQDASDFEDNFKLHANNPIESCQLDGIPVIAEATRVGDSFDRATFDMCRKETWYSQSVRVQGQILTDSGDGLTWFGEYPYWVDVVSGKCLRQENLISTYAPVVTVDDVPMTERYYFDSSGGDYVVNHVEGSITFSSSQSGKTVVASYSRVEGQWWELAPPAAHKLLIEDVEVQFSSDVVMNDAIDMCVVINHPIYGDIVAETVSYESLRQLIAEARGSYPVIPATGGASRGLIKSVVGFPFRYRLARTLLSSCNMRLRVGCRQGNQMGGEMATCTFYCTVVLEA